MERKEPSTSEVAHIGAELALFKGAICERAEISGAVLAPINFKVAPVFFKFTLHMVQFGPYNGVNSAPKLVPKTAPFQWGRIDPKRVPNWTHSFWPHFWGQINSFNFTVYSRGYRIEYRKKSEKTPCNSSQRAIMKQEQPKKKKCKNL